MSNDTRETEEGVQTRISESSGNCSSIPILTSSSKSFPLFFFLADGRPRTFLYPRCDASTFPPNLLERIQSPSLRRWAPNKPPNNGEEEEVEYERLERQWETNEGNDGSLDGAVSECVERVRKMKPAAAMEETSKEEWRLRRRIGGRRDLIRAGDGDWKWCLAVYSPTIRRERRKPETS